MNDTTMKKKFKKQKAADDLRPEYDLSALKNGVRGEYFALRGLIDGTIRPRAAHTCNHQRDEVISNRSYLLGYLGWPGVWRQLFGDF
jgi:hypothetical protein